MDLAFACLFALIIVNVSDYMKVIEVRYTRLNYLKLYLVLWCLVIRLCGSLYLWTSVGLHESDRNKIHTPKFNVYLTCSEVCYSNHGSMAHCIYGQVSDYMKVIEIRYILLSLIMCLVLSSHHYNGFALWLLFMKISDYMKVIEVRYMSLI